MFRKILFSVIVMASLSFSAQAVVIDFESTGTPGSYNDLSYPIDGFVFNFTMDNIDISSTSPWGTYGPAYSGNFAALNNYGGPGEITLDGGGTFSFQDLWLKGWGGDSGEATVSGWLNGAVVGSVYGYMNADSWTDFSGNFSNIDKLQIDPGSGHVFLADNIKLNSPISAIPEPQTYAMLLAGLGLLGYTARRRKDPTA